MEIYNGIYSWDGKRHGSREPIAWFPGSYHLRIIEIAGDSGNVTALKRHLCIYSETGSGHSISAHPEKFAKRVCSDFSLDLERVLWVEQVRTDGDRLEVVVYSRSNRLGDHFFYRVDKRLPNVRERRLIDTVLQAERS